MVTCVLDASYAIAWAMPDEISPSLQVWMDIGSNGAYVTAHWPLEVCNSIVLGYRRKRLTTQQASALLKEMSALNIKIDDATARHAWSETTDLALRRNLTVYDAAYLELALRRDLPLATRDERLRDAALAEGCALL